MEIESPFPLGQGFLSEFNLALIDFDAPNGCWTYTHFLNKKGYAKIAGQAGHRVVWREAVDSNLDRSVDLDHLCENRTCVNPDHLEPVPHSVNIRRRHGWTQDELGVWYCAAGHNVEGINIYHKPGGRIECGPCRRKRSLDWHTSVRKGADVDRETTTQGSAMVDS